MWPEPKPVVYQQNNLYNCIQQLIALDFNGNILLTESGPNLHKKCVRFSEAACSYEILRKIYFVVEPLKKVGIEDVEILSTLFL